MNYKRLFSLLLGIFLLLSLAGCSSKSIVNSAEDTSFSGDSVTPESNKLVTNQEIADIPLPDNRKLIQTVTISAETEDLDALITQISSRINEVSGYVESQNIHNGSAYKGTRYRNAEMTIRIPADNLDAFVDQISQVSNIVSSNKTVDDVTLQYVATESRINALKTEENRLLELLSKAETMNDLLIIESRLTDVRYELEQVTSTLKVYDNQVNYGTVHLSISEVKEYTVTEEPTTVWGRIGQVFSESAADIGNGFVDAFVFIAGNILYFLMIAIFPVVGTILWRLRKKKKAEKDTHSENHPE